MTHPYPPPGPDAVLAAIEQQAIQLTALQLADQWRVMTTESGPCRADQLGLGPCECCQLETLTIQFLYGIAHRGENHA